MDEAINIRQDRQMQTRPELSCRFSRYAILALTCGLVPAGCAQSEPQGLSAAFEEFAWESATPDVRQDRLCPEAADPDGTTDPVFLDCRIEGANLSAKSPDAADQLIVVAWNILRGFEATAQIALLVQGDVLPTPDVILLSEADRGCERTDFRNIAREFAEALGYYYVFGTEFVELPSERSGLPPWDTPICEHGNAIVSRFPLGNVRQIRHAEQSQWYTPPGHPDPDEPRLGGRVAIAADARVATATGDRLVRFYALHLESRVLDMSKRDAQAIEIQEDALAVPHAVIVGGDFNSYGVLFDIGQDETRSVSRQTFLESGFMDAHNRLALDERPTDFDDGLVIDLLLSRDLAASEAGLCNQARCRSLSDHAPIWATFPLPQNQSSAPQ